jgi:hypothetical protein
MAIWRAFHNAYWPALYFIDASGKVRHRHIGEGDYEASERVIQKLLAEGGQRDVPSDLVMPPNGGAEAPADEPNLRSGENYLGYSRTEGVAAKLAPNAPRDYAQPGPLRLNTWSPVGRWSVRGESALLMQPGGRIAYQFHARDLHLVMGPAIPGARIAFRVTIDGKPPGPDRGVDVDELGRGTLDGPRMYQLIRQTGKVGDRRFEIEFLGADVEVFSFTFG